MGKIQEATPAQSHISTCAQHVLPYSFFFFFFGETRVALFSCQNLSTPVTLEVKAQQYTKHHDLPRVPLDFIVAHISLYKPTQ